MPSSKFDIPVEGLCTIPLNTHPKLPQALFHHRLRPFEHRWSHITTDRWVLQTITLGHTIPFTALPPPNPPAPSLFRDPSDEPLLQQEVDRLLAIGAIEIVPKQFRGRGFYSRYFLTEKKSGGWRPILDLRGLNRYLWRYRFRMVTLATIIPALHSGDWFTSLDLQDAYFHVAIHPAHRRFLRFQLGAGHFQYRVLPFGLSSAPRVFSKTLAVVTAYLRRLGIIIFPYLDDCLIKAPSAAEALRMTRLTRTVFETLGLIINIPKSAMTPQQSIQFIGAQLDSTTALALLPITRFQAMQDLIQAITTNPRPSVLQCLRLMGHMAATTYIVEHARLHFRCLQHWIATVYTPNVRDVQKRVSIPMHVTNSLTWWTAPKNLMSGVPFHRQHLTIQLTTDASLIGWGAHLEHNQVQGLWSPEESMLHINLLEL